MKIGIMGGTFNPIHNGHLAIASYAAEELGLDKVLFMTGAVPPHKNNEIADVSVRHEMVCRAIEKYKKFYPCAYEIEKGGVSYTVETLRYLKKEYPDDGLYFIMGADSLNDFGKWYKPEEIVKYCTLAVYPRTGVDTEFSADRVRSEYGGEVKIINAPILEISSTEIRSRIKNGQDIDFFVPCEVSYIIKEDKLYV